MDEIRATGKTVDDALTEALIQLRTTSDQVEYEVIEKGSSGFLGIGSKPAVIVVRKKQEEPVDIEEEEKQNKAESKLDEKLKKIDKKIEKKSEKAFEKAAEKAEKAEQKIAEFDARTEKAHKDAEVFEEKTENKPVQKPVTPLNKEEVEQKTDAFLKEIFRVMNMDVKRNYETDEENRTLSIELEGNEMGILIGKRGQTLDSLQYLISLVVNKGEKEYIRVKLDTENYRKRRRATLENLAKNIAYKVKRERKPVTLEPMNPYERRIIHSTLQNDRYVETHSEGSEPYRRVVVSLKKNQ